MPRKITGASAEYGVIRKLGVGWLVETYMAKVVRILGRGRFHRELCLNEHVVIRFPRIDRSRPAAQTAAGIAAFNATTTASIVATERLSSVEAVEHLLDVAIFQIPVRDMHVPVQALVQEFIEGQSLDTHLRATFAKKDKDFQGVGDLLEYLSFAQKLVTLVQMVHRKKIVHGGISPENIMVRNGSPVLTDFGSVLFCRQVLRHTVFASERLHPYSAPEMHLTRDIDRSTDIYALGGVLYYLATGEDPPVSTPDDSEFEARIATRVAVRNPVLATEIGSVTHIIAECLRYRGDQRMPNASALLREIRASSRALASRWNERPRSDRTHFPPQVKKALVRYASLVDKKFSGALSKDEEAEVVRLGGMLDDFEDPYYEPIIRDLTEIRDKLTRRISRERRGKR